MPLQELWLTPGKFDNVEVLRDMKTLKTINNWDPAHFWSAIER